jgi:hypothetical protein
VLSVTCHPHNPFPICRANASQAFFGAFAGQGLAAQIYRELVHGKMAEK